MSRDHSEYLDDYCYSKYGHFNWGYLDTYTKEDLKGNGSNLYMEKDGTIGKSKWGGYDIENNIVFWHKATTDD